MRRHYEKLNWWWYYNGTNLRFPPPHILRLYRLNFLFRESRELGPASIKTILSLFHPFTYMKIINCAALGLFQRKNARLKVKVDIKRSVIAKTQTYHNKSSIKSKAFQFIFLSLFVSVRIRRLLHLCQVLYLAGSLYVLWKMITFQMTTYFCGSLGSLFFFFFWTFGFFCAFDSTGSAGSGDGLFIAVI